MAILLLFCILFVRIIPVFIIALFSSKGFIDIGQIDPLLYLGGAQAILNKGSNPFNYFPPLNFFFIATFLYLGNNNPLVPLFAIAIIGWLSVVAIYLIAKELFSEKTALFAALISGLYPNFVFYGVIFYSETLALFWIVCALWMLVTYFHSSRLYQLMLSGVFWALASQTRAGLNYFAFCIGAVIFFHGIKKTPKLTVFFVCPFLCFFLVSFFAVDIALKPIHGDTAFNSKNGLATVALGVNRIMSPCCDYGDVKGSLFYDIDLICNDRWPTESRIDPLEIISMGIMQTARKVVTFILHDPVTYITNSLGKLSCFWSPNQYIIHHIKIMLRNYNSMITNSICFLLALIYATIICGGLWGLTISHEPLRPVFISFIIYYCVLIFFTVGHSRLRLPLMPFFIIYCSYLLMQFKTGVWKRALANKWALIIILIFLTNSVYKYPEILLSPAEIQVRKIELCNQLGFPKTALCLLEKNKNYTFTDEQKKRLEVAEASAKQKLAALPEKN
jgi:4-amino-4-deoxy-L-arabinose transferase-like glycosyltransferase